MYTQLMIIAPRALQKKKLPLAFELDVVSSTIHLTMSWYGPENRIVLPLGEECNTWMGFKILLQKLSLYEVDTLRRLWLCLEEHREGDEGVTFLDDTPPFFLDAPHIQHKVWVASKYVGPLKGIAFNFRNIRIMRAHDANRAMLINEAMAQLYQTWAQ